MNVLCKLSYNAWEGTVTLNFNKKSTKKGLLFKEESKETYFFKESIAHPFVQFSTLKMELYLTNNDFADILAFVEQTGMASLTSL